MSMSDSSSSRRQLAEMKHTLALARVARDEVRAAHAASVQKLTAARMELTTIERRGDLARQIDDQETVAVAERFAESQRATIALLQRKVGVLQDELAQTERTVGHMEADLRAATGRGGSGAPSGDATSAGRDADDGSDAADPTIGTAEYRGLDEAARAQTADERLAELKRRMGRAP